MALLNQISTFVDRFCGTPIRVQSGVPLLRRAGCGLPLVVIICDPCVSIFVYLFVCLFDPCGQFLILIIILILSPSGISTVYRQPSIYISAAPPPMFTS